ncbi:MAG: hypothetical protein EPO13_05930 [Actinomycetota bacterium]|nr:MAG: hypothetical protein EPO13_05930 [Actinomycetota bacterium]
MTTTVGPAAAVIVAVIAASVAVGLWRREESFRMVRWAAEQAAQERRSDHDGPAVGTAVLDYLTATTPGSRRWWEPRRRRRVLDAGGAALAEVVSAALVEELRSRVAVAAAADTSVVVTSDAFPAVPGQGPYTVRSEPVPGEATDDDDT